MSKLLVLTLNEQEEKAINKIISAIADYIQIEPMQVAPVSILSFPGLEIRQHQRRVLQGGEDVSLTALNTARLYSLLLIPALSSQGRKFLKLFGTWTVIVVNQAFLP